MRKVTYVVMWFTVNGGCVQCVAALGGQTQEEAANEPAGQDDVPFDKVCGLRRRGGKHTHQSIRA